MGKSRSATVLLAYLLWSSRQKSISTSASPQQSSPDGDMVPLPTKTKPLSVVEALILLRQGRPIAEPNEGFMDQLHMYESMGCPTTEAELKKHKIYRRWMNKRSVEESLRVNMAPEMDSIIFEDEADGDDDDDDDDDEAGNDNINDHSKASPASRSSLSNSPVKKDTRSQGQIKSKGVSSVAPGIKAPDGTSSPSSSIAAISTTSPSQTTPEPVSITLRCRKCRQTLATTPFILSHTPPPHADPSSTSSSPSPSSSADAVGSPSPKCAHIFLHPLSWMRPALAEGQMEGRLSCPNLKCNTNIGKFSWTGLRCSCGGWVTPGFGVTRGRVDEVVSRSGGTIGGGVRMPPGMRRGGGNL